MNSKRVAYALIFLVSAVVIALESGCKAGWAWWACVEHGLTIYTPAGGGEFLLTEVASVALVLCGIFVSLIAYTNGEQRRVRVSVVFLMLFITAFISENNLMRDDLRAQFLLVLLVWLGIELLLRRLYTPIVLLVLGFGVAFVGSLGDHTMHIQFRKVFGEDISDSALAPIQQFFSDQEEAMEFAGWGFVVAAAIRALDIRFIRTQSTLFFVLIAAALLAITVGDTFLHLRQTETLYTARKFGFFVSVTGVAFLSAAAYISTGTAHATSAARIHCATLTLAAYLLFVFAPTVYTGETTKTISTWTWLVPLLVLHYYLVTRRRIHSADSESLRATGSVSQTP